MRRRRVFAALLASGSAALAGLSNGNPRLERLYANFIAPCCWRENLEVHHSPMADELRAEIQRLVAAGKSDEQIQAEFIAKYSTRVLALPQGARAQWLQWTPVAAGLIGLGIVALVIQRSLRKFKEEKSDDGHYDGSAADAFDEF